MKKFMIIAILAGLTVNMCACGKEAKASADVSTSRVEQVTASSSEEAYRNTQSPTYTPLVAPEIEDGVTREGDDCVEVYFEWEAVDEADGYEVFVQQKDHGADKFSDDDAVVEETDETSYVISTQDAMDYEIMVRAYKDSDDGKTYSVWSLKATGTSYDEELLAKARTDYSLYDDVIEKVSDVKSRIAGGDDIDYTERDNLDISDLFYQPTDGYDPFGYTRRDLDGDGVEELILGYNSASGDEYFSNLILDLYTIRDGQLIHVFDGGERNRYYLTTDGMIENQGSDSFDCSKWTYYTYEDGGITPFETVFTEGEGELRSNIHWYYSQGMEPYKDYSNEISDYEGRSVTTKYVHQSLDFTPF